MVAQANDFCMPSGLAPATAELLSVCHMQHMLKRKHRGSRLVHVLSFAPVVFICLPQPNIEKHARDCQPNSFLTWLPMTTLRTLVT